MYGVCCRNRLSSPPRSHLDYVVCNGCYSYGIYPRLLKHSWHKPRGVELWIIFDESMAQLIGGLVQERRNSSVLAMD